MRRGRRLSPTRHTERPVHVGDDVEVVIGWLDVGLEIIAVMAVAPLASTDSMPASHH